MSKRDVQNFLKRLRFNVWQKIKGIKLRFFISAEYGSQTLRPHYHMLLFNFPLELDAYEYILKAWNMGVVQVGQLQDSGGNYAAKYILHPLDEIDYTERTKPFSLMSRKPGIGLAYITPEIKRYYNENKTYLATLSGGRRMPLPRYYREKIFDSDTLREISDLVVKEAQERRMSEFHDDLRKYGHSREYERKREYDRKVRNSLTKQNRQSKL